MAPRLRYMVILGLVAMLDVTIFCKHQEGVEEAEVKPGSTVRSLLETRKKNQDRSAPRAKNDILGSANMVSLLGPKSP